MNEELLLRKIEESHLSKVYIAKSIGITRQALHDKMCGKREFKSSEMKKLAKVLHLSVKEREAIFFADAVDR